MSYAKQNFSNDEILYAEQLNAMEDQIGLNESNIRSLTGRKINGKALSADITLTAADIGVLPNGESIPSYITNEVDRLASVVQSRQNANTITFLACSDIHYYSPNNANVNANATNMHEAVVSMGQAMGLLRERVHIDFAAMFGDMTWDYGETHDEVLSEMRFVNSCLNKGFSGIPQFRMEGNHEDAYESGGNLTASEVFANIGAWNGGAEYGSRADGYCYRDFDSVKLRVICLNSSQYKGSSAQYNAEQIAWLATALDLSDKDQDWKSIIIGHHPLDWGRAGGVDPTTTITSASGLIASFHGHIHNFLTGTVTNTELPRIAIPNAGYSRENQYGESYGINWKEDTTYSKTPGTAENTSFCVITIDTASKKIYADHYGAGYSRIIPYDGSTLASYTITNNLTKVISSNNSSTVTEGAAYSTTLNPSDGYTIESVIVTMGGVDVTSASYNNGKVSITAVTGDLVITATAVVEPEVPPAEPDVPEEPSVNYTNLVPTSQYYDSSNIYGVDYNNDDVADGYKNDTYISSGPSWKDKTGYVATGLIPYSGETIYIKGATLSTSDNYCRWHTAYLNKTNGLQIEGNAIATYFTIETLGEMYYKLTPTQAYTDNADKAKWYRMSLLGTGDNLVITHNQPIE